MLAGKSLLIVDDDPGVRFLYEKVLTKAGCKVSVAEDGDLAVAMMEMAPADLVLMDMLMPRKDGVGAIMAFKDRWPACVIVAMSGGGWIDAEGCLTLAKLAGAHGLIRKPMPIRELVQALSDIFSDTLKIKAA